MVTLMEGSVGRSMVWMVYRGPGVQGSRGPGVQGSMGGWDVYCRCEGSHCITVTYPITTLGFCCKIGKLCSNVCKIEKERLCY